MSAELLSRSWKSSNSQVKIKWPKKAKAIDSTIKILTNVAKETCDRNTQTQQPKKLPDSRRWEPLFQTAYTFRLWGKPLPLLAKLQEEHVTGYLFVGNCETWRWALHQQTPQTWRSQTITQVSLLQLRYRSSFTLSEERGPSWRKKRAVKIAPNSFNLHSHLC